ncbi:hypothetical protein CDL15_Pgr001635 [Punica granatum]|uniref:Uncharacterized protein n=1 Tax=Punica granatum TaxID=22663 RepID=A0A218XC19_PUNGR|nr:hypothetical protein CDL15_Pgr001635 [Punica granatum]
MTFAPAVSDRSGRKLRSAHSRSGGGCIRRSTFSGEAGKLSLLKTSSAVLLETSFFASQLLQQVHHSGHAESVNLLPMAEAVEACPDDAEVHLFITRTPWRPLH